MLIQDPLSLNYLRPISGDNIASKILEDNVRSNAKSTHIRNLFNTYMEKSFQEIIKYLMTKTPYTPRVLNEIARNTPQGAKTSL